MLPCIYTLSLHDALPIWVIVGGESGPGARLMQPDWARGVRDQCQREGVAFFFKQWGNIRSNPNRQDSTAKENGGTAKGGRDRKSTRLNSSHVSISYAVFC